MAIIVEEERGGINLIKIAMWFLILLIIALAGYYIFFARPQFIEIVAPANFRNIDPLAGINLNPETVISSPEFQSLKQYVTPPVPGNAGKSNPFSP